MVASTVLVEASAGPAGPSAEVITLRVIWAIIPVVLPVVLAARICHSRIVVSSSLPVSAFTLTVSLFSTILSFVGSLPFLRLCKFDLLQNFHSVLCCC